VSSYRYLSAVYIRPLCVDADLGFQRCDSGQLTFSEELTFEPNNGRKVSVTRYEQLYGRYTDYRPVYKALVPDGSSIEVYLYHANGTWRLGHDYITSMFGKVNDTALRPEFITGVWQFQDNGVWRRNNNLKVRCSGKFRLRCFITTEGSIPCGVGREYPPKKENSLTLLA